MTPVATRPQQEKYHIMALIKDAIVSGMSARVPVSATVSVSTDGISLRFFRRCRPRALGAPRQGKASARMTSVSSGRVFAEDPGRLMVTVLAPSVSADELSEIWLELEQRSEASFFQSWGWIGTWYRSLPDTVERIVFQAHHAGRLVAMGVLAKPRASGSRILSLHETGDIRFDAITIEHNGILCDRDWAAQYRATLLEALVPLFPNMRRLRLPGVADAYRDVAAPTGFELSQVEKRIDQ